ncbi:hypothetical protein KJ693_01820 [bacterium]|nr:hypothetical protein [bacterium]MBU1614028.1 hypothetical protein [bacterium]
MRTSKSVIIDNTVFSNFAVVDQFRLLKELFKESAWTTSQVHDEITRGINLGYAFMKKADQQLIISSPSGWIKIAMPTTVTEHQLYARFSQTLGLGEASCLSLAIERKMILLTDDKLARKNAISYNISLSGTVGALTRAVQKQLLSLQKANELLAKMIKYKYHSPVTKLDDLI